MGEKIMEFLVGALIGVAIAAAYWWFKTQEKAKEGTEKPQDNGGPGPIQK
jgi:hypothetical protein